MKDDGKASVWLVLIIILLSLLIAFVLTYVIRDKKYKELIENERYEEAIRLFPKKEEAYIKMAKEYWYRSNNGILSQVDVVDCREKACDTANQGIKETGSEELSKLLTLYEKYRKNLNYVIIKDDGQIIEKNRSYMLNDKKRHGTGKPGIYVSPVF